MAKALGVDHRESVRVTPGATVESFRNWLGTLPATARISVSHSTMDYSQGVNYIIVATWTTTDNIKEI